MLEKSHHRCDSAIQLSAETKAEVKRVYAKDHALYSALIEKTATGPKLIPLSSLRPLMLGRGFL